MVASPLSKVGKKVQVRGLPHLAKNQRDMGHPTILGREKGKDPDASCKGKETSVFLLRPSLFGRSVSSNSSAAMRKLR
jgi:hypothetical protein